MKIKPENRIILLNKNKSILIPVTLKNGLWAIHVAFTVQAIFACFLTNRIILLATMTLTESPEIRCDHFIMSL